MCTYADSTGSLVEDTHRAAGWVDVASTVSGILSDTDAKTACCSGESTLLCRKFAEKRPADAATCNDYVPQASCKYAFLSFPVKIRQYYFSTDIIIGVL